MKTTPGKKYLVVLALLLQACSLEPQSQEAGPSSSTATERSSGHRNVPLQDFIAGYLHLAASNGYNPDTRLRIPAIWLYSPNGMLFKQVDQDNDLPKIPSYLANEHLSEPDGKNVPFSLIQKTLTDKTNTAVPIAPDGKRWIALLLLIDPGCGDRCPRYQQTILNLEKEMPDRVQTMTLTLAK